MGDMLVKKGDVAKARVMYENAKLPKSYATWNLRAVIDERIAQADENVAAFRNDEQNNRGGSPGAQRDPKRRPFWTSSFACTGCHAN